MQNGTAIDYDKNLTEDDLYYSQALIRQTREDFVLFLNTVFRISLEIVDGEYTPGAWLDTFAARLEKYKKTCTLAPRKHAKTTIVAAFVCWLIFRADLYSKMVSEYLYIMYSDELASEKIKKIKQYISFNPYFAHIRDLKPTAESVIEYENNEKIISVKPAGVFTFKRGKHVDGAICDDILRDPQKKLDLIQIDKITQVFEAEITAIPKEDGFLHVIGTGQDETDILFKLEKLPGWNWSLNPAIIDRRKKIVLWAEKFSFERLIDIELNETGKKNFLKEYQMQPVRMTEGYFSRAEVEALIDKELKNYPVIERGKDDIEFGECYAGADLGKKRHPSHVAIFEAVREKEKTYLIQVASIWLDGVDYNDQLKIFDAAIKRFGIVAMLWDNTRGEFDGFSERGELPDEMKPYTFTAGGKEQIAAEFDKAAGTKTLILLEDDRQTRSILTVDGNLQAAESPEGHGDAFWSISLAIKAFTENNVALMI